MAADFAVENFRKGGSNAIYVIISAENTIDVRCAGYDINGKPLGVSDYQTVEAPIGEVLVYAKGIANNAKTVKCWDKK